MLGPSSSRWLIKLVLYYYLVTCNCYLIILMGCIQLLVYFIGRCYSCNHLLRIATQNIICLLTDGIQIMISQLRGGANNKFQRVCRYLHIPQSIATSTQCTPARTHARTHTTTLQKPTTSINTTLTEKHIFNGICALKSVHEAAICLHKRHAAGLDLDSR